MTKFLQITVVVLALLGCNFCCLAFDAPLVDDTYVVLPGAGAPTKNGQAPVLTINGKHNALFKFSLADLPLNTDPGAIGHAVFTVFVNKVVRNGVIGLIPFKNGQAWDEEHIPVLCQTSFGDMEQPVAVRMPFQDFVTFDVTDYVVQVLSNEGVTPSTVVTFAVGVPSASGTSAAAAVLIDSKENAVTSHCAKLSIDFTASEAPIQTVAGRTGNVVLSSSDVTDFVQAVQTAVSSTGSPVLSVNGRAGAVTVSGTDLVGNLSGILKWNGSGQASAALPGTDYIPLNAHAGINVGLSSSSSRSIFGGAGVLSSFSSIPATIAAGSAGEAPDTAGFFETDWLPSTTVSGGPNPTALVATAFMRGTGDVNMDPSLNAIQATISNKGAAHVASMNAFLTHAGNQTTTPGKTLSNLHLFHAISPLASLTQPVTNSYAFHADPQTIDGVTNGYGIAADGSNDQNYFMGKVAIGANSAGQTGKLYVLESGSSHNNAITNEFRYNPAPNAAFSGPYSTQRSFLAVGGANGYNALGDVNVGMSSVIGEFYNQGSGTISDISSFNAKIGNLGTGTITNAYGYTVNVRFAGSSSPMTNVYGFYAPSLAAQGVANSYAFVQTGTSDRNSFAGPTQQGAHGSYVSEIRHGSIVLASGSATVTDPYVSGSTRIFVNSMSDSVVGSLRAIATPGTGFTVKSSNLSDEGVVVYQEVEP
jgi:hypothetical protein